MPQRVDFSLDLPMRVAVYPAPDIEGQWIAHCLELDLVTQGDSQQHAQEMMRDAIQTMVAYNVEHGLMPLSLHLAPKEIWEAFGLELPRSIEAHATFRTSGDDHGYEAGPFTPSLQPILRDRAPPVHAG